MPGSRTGEFSGLAIAAIRAEETARPDRLFADPLAGAFVAASGWPPPRRPGDRRAAALKIWVVARTVFLDELLSSACRDGCRQIVLLGAGFDARAFRLPWPPGVRCYELDAAGVLDRKADVLAAQAAVAGCERIPVVCDLGGDWPASLLAADFAPEQPTAWLAEGLLVYLTASEADGVLADLTGLSAPGSMLGLTMAGPAPVAGHGQGQTRRTAPRRSAGPDDPVRWLTGHGWTAQVDDALEVLASHGRPVPAGSGQPARPRALLIMATRDTSPPPGQGEPGRAEPVRELAIKPGAGAGAAHRPLPALLSQVLVAFTIEFDNEFEHQMPHRTARGPAAGPGRGPWLASMAMWSNFMQFVTEEGVPFGEMEGLARLANVPGLERWGYIVVEPDPRDSRPKPPRSDWVVRPTAAGRRAQQVWRPLASVIEERWQARFGAAEIGGLIGALQALASQFTIELPCYLPVRGIWTQDLAERVAAGRPPGPRHRGAGTASRPDLSVLLSQVLLAFTIDFERESALSLPVSANGLRILTEEGVRVRDIPLRAGISREAVSVFVGFLEKQGHVVVEPDPAGGRAKLARLTRKGRRAQAAYHQILGVIEERWEARFGAGAIRTLRESLQRLFDRPAGEQPRISQGLVPYPGGWRAHTPYLTQTTAVISDPSGALPRYPVVSHRGGYPDGS